MRQLFCKAAAAQEAEVVSDRIVMATGDHCMLHAPQLQGQHHYNQRNERWHY